MTYDDHLSTAFRSLRHPLTHDVDVRSNVDRSLWYDLIEELRERGAAARLRCASGNQANVPTLKADGPVQLQASDPTS